MKKTWRRSISGKSSAYAGDFRRICIILGILLILPAAAVFAGAAAADVPCGNWTDETNFNASWYAGSVAAGTYVITGAKDLAALAYETSVNATKHDFTGITITVTASAIDLAAHHWTPVGTKNNKFNGSFDGHGCTISHLYIDAFEAEYQGFFGYADTGSKIQNVILSGVSINGKKNVGGLTGYAKGAVSSCSASGSVNGQDSVGGLIGYVNGTVSSCYATGPVTGTGSYVGGLVGQAGKYSSVSNCYATGSVNGNQYIGGLVGEAKTYSSLSNCYATGQVNGNKYVGGLIGSTNGAVSNSLALNEKVTGTSNVGRVAGSVPDSEYDDSKVYGLADMLINGAKAASGGGINGTGVTPVKVWDTFPNGIWNKENAGFSAANWKANSGNDNFKLPVLSWMTSDTTSDARHLVPVPVEVSEWAQLVENVTKWTDTESQLTIIVKTDVRNETGTPGDYAGIPVCGNVKIIPGASSVTIDANRTGRLFEVKSGANLTIADNNDAKLTLTGGNITDRGGGGVYVGSGGTFTMEGGSITGCTVFIWNGGGVAVDGGTFNMTGGSIAGCTAADGGGVYVGSGGTFNMTGGSITECTAESNWGGGVYVANGGIFTMESGSITDCTASKDGGGAYVVCSEFTMKGGEITRCIAENNGGGGVAVTSGTFTMEGGSIKNCEAAGITGWAGGVYVSGIFNMTGGSITGCKAAFLSGGACVAMGSMLNLSGNVEITGNTVSGAANNLFLGMNTSLNLTGPFTGSIGISYAGTAPAAGQKFGNAAEGVFGADKFFSDDGKFTGSISGSDLVWKAKAAPAPQPTAVPTKAHTSSGSSGNSGAGNYNYYPRQADGQADTIDFGTSKTVKSVTLPEGVKGEVTLVAKSTVPAPAGYDTHSVFEINIPNYPKGQQAVIEFSIDLNTLAKEGKTPADVGLLHGDGTSWDASTLPVTYSVNGKNVVYHATTTSFSPFAIVYTEGAAAPENEESASAVVPEYDPSQDETEQTPDPAKTAETKQTLAPSAAQAKAAASPLMLSGILAGLAAAVVFGRRE